MSFEAVTNLIAIALIIAMVPALTIMMYKLNKALHNHEIIFRNQDLIRKGEESILAAEGALLEFLKNRYPK